MNQQKNVEGKETLPTPRNFSAGTHVGGPQCAETFTQNPETCSVAKLLELAWRAD